MTSVTRRPRHRSWTPALRRRFVDSLAMSGQVRPSAALCGLSRQSVYRLRERDPEFAAQWDAAVAGFPAAVRRDVMSELARSIEAGLAAGIYDQAFFDLLVEIAGEELLASVDPGVLPSRTVSVCQSVSTKVH